MPNPTVRRERIVTKNEDGTIVERIRSIRLNGDVREMAFYKAPDSQKLAIWHLVYDGKAFWSTVRTRSSEGLTTWPHGRRGVMAKSEVTKVLAGDLRDRIDEFLAGKVSGPAVSRRATDALIRDTGADPLVDEALIALSNLDHTDDRRDTPKEDLAFLRDCLAGKKRYSPALVQGSGQEN